MIRASVALERRPRLDKRGPTWFASATIRPELRAAAARRLFALRNQMVRRAFVSAVLLAAAFAPASARADFRLCNNTNTRVSVAIAYTDGKAWLSEGWWNLRPTACETLLRGPLAAQFYYVYAMDERGGEWKGKAFMCTRDREFRVDGREDCFARGYERTGFFEIDTGRDAKSWTVQLTDPNAAPAQ